jgi:hypothetical protein
MRATDPGDVEEHERVGARGVAGEVAVVLSLRGNLRRLAITPAAVPAPSAVGAMSWADLLAAAGLPTPSELEELASTDFVPPMFAEERHVWRAHDPGGEELRVYAAAYAGSPVFFALQPAEARPPGVAASAGGGLDFMAVVQLGTLLLLALGGWLAWRNLRVGRADRRGALRLGALVLLLAGVVQGFLVLLTVPAAREQLSGVVFEMLQWTLLLAALVALLYLALEPEIRRRRPRAAVAWARLLRGGIGDPLVGRELLLGIACGAALTGLWAVEQWTVLRLGVPWHLWEPVFAQWMLLSSLQVLQAFAGALPIMGVVVFVPLLLYAWLLPLLRSPIAAEAAAVVLTTGLAMLFTTEGFTVSGLLLGAMIALLSLRVGIVAAIAAVTFWPILISGAYTIDSSRFYFTNTLVALGVYGCVAVLAWRAAVRRPASGHASQS